VCPLLARELGRAWSGQTQRHRLSRGGDRQLNRALHTIALHRRQHDPSTRAYIETRIAEGKSGREALRCLKRQLARTVYVLLKNEPLLTKGQHWPKRDFCPGRQLEL